MNPLFWEPVPLHEAQSKLDEGGTLTYIPSRQTFYYVGAPMVSQGQAKEAKKAFGFKKPTTPEEKLNQFSTVFEFNPKTASWQNLETTGRIPNQRNFHLAVQESDILIVYGGQEKKISGDLAALHVRDLVWKKLFCLERPPLRLHSTFTKVDHKMYVIGGASMPENLLSNEVWCLSIDGVKWEHQSLELPGSVWSKIELTNHSALPPLKGHAAVECRGCILVAGGYNQHHQPDPQVFLIDIAKRAVEQLKLKGEQLVPRAFAKISCLSKDMYVVLGGLVSKEYAEEEQRADQFQLIDIQNRICFRPMAGGERPCFRTNMGMDASGDGRLLLYGGSPGEMRFWSLREIEDEECYIQEEEPREEQHKRVRALGKITPAMEQIVAGQKMYNEQRRVAGELEKKIRDLRTRNSEREKEIAAYTEKIEQGHREINERTRLTQQSIKESENQNAHKHALIERLKAIAVLERKRRKIHKAKTRLLEQAVLKAETFVLQTDSFYKRCLKNDLFDGLISEAMIEKVEASKKQHIESIGSLRSDLEQLMGKESILKEEMRRNKTALKAEFDVSQAYKATLSSLEASLLRKSQ